MSKTRKAVPEAAHPDSRSQFSLFRSRKFAPLFVTMFLGAFNDNFFKSAMIILITYRLADTSGVDVKILVALAAGIFILPFLLFSAFAGQLADKYERSSLVQKIKIAEIAVMLLAVLGFYCASIILLMAVLFLMGAQSAFFGPLKYSILPQHLGADQLIGANALVEMGTFLAILLGTIFGGLFVLGKSGLEVVSLLVLLIALTGWWASRQIPPTVPIDPSLVFRTDIFSETLAIIVRLMPRREIFTVVVFISWFYFVGAAFLSLFPTYAKISMGANEQVATMFLAVFSVGIGLGSLVCNALLGGKVSGKYVSAAAAGMSLASLFLFWASMGAGMPDAEKLIGIGTFLASPRNIAIILCLLGISFFGGIYIVPLYAIVQTRTPEKELAQVVACNNIVDSLFMVASSFATAAMLWAGVTIPQIFLVLALLTIVAAWLIRRSGVLA